MQNFSDEIKMLLAELSSEVDYSQKEISIILAAGHGKRIKSNTSKMLHKIWQVPTVTRVASACRKGLPNSNTIIVVGIKASEVMQSVGKLPSNKYAYQEVQEGTGHAVQIALDEIDKDSFSGIVYVYPGDMGLLDAETVKMFSSEFKNSGLDMMVLTGLYEGRVEENNYGRIIRVKDTDVKGKPSGTDCGKVIEIMEHKDILQLDKDTLYVREFNGNIYGFTKEELINNNEFNSGVYAFKSEHLFKLINDLKSNNAQKEIYITDLIYLFNKNGLSVGAVSPNNQNVVMGFNNKSVLLQMEKAARDSYYNQLKDIIEIENPDDFYIDEEIIADFLERDKNGVLLDIKIGSGAYLGNGVKLETGISIGRGTRLKGNIYLKEGVSIGDYSEITAEINDKVVLGKNSSIGRTVTIKGSVEISESVSIDNSSTILGTTEKTTIIGRNASIGCGCYISSCRILDGIIMEYSALKEMIVEPVDGTCNISFVFSGVDRKIVR